MVHKILFVCFITFNFSMKSFVSAHGFIPEEVYGTVVGNGISIMNHNAVRKIIERFKGQNFLLSPFTVYQTLCLLANGASDEKLDQFLKLLNVPNTNVMNIGIQSVKNKIYETRRHPRNIDFVGSLWHAFYINLDMDIIEQFYAETIVQHGSTFSTPDRDRGELNAFIKAQTYGRISNLFPEGCPSFEDRLTFADAMHVKSRIELPCQASKIQFWKSHVKYYTVPAVEIRGQMSIYYHQETGVDIVTLPFLSGAYKLIFVKSFHPIDFFLSHITVDNAKQLLNNLSPNYDNKIIIPKFKLDLTMDAKTLLQDLDFNDIFDQEKADLSKLSNDKTWLTSFKHRSIFSFNDDECSATFKRSWNDYPFQFNEEFAFFVVESHFFTILLSGKVTDPRESVTIAPALGISGTTEPPLIDGHVSSPASSLPPGVIETTTTSLLSTGSAKESTPFEQVMITIPSKTFETISTSSEPTMLAVSSLDIANASSYIDTNASIPYPSKADDSGEVATKGSIASTKLKPATSLHIYPSNSGVTLVNSMMTLFVYYIVAFIIV